jgi:FMN phosphatase YigB (HAD superfamily)
MVRRFLSVIFLDLDGTIMVNPFESAVWPVVLSELSVRSGVTVDKLYQMIATENRQRQDDPACGAVKAMDWDDIVQTVAARLGTKVNANCEALVRQYAATHSAILDQGDHILKKLRQEHRALVVATKGLRKYQQPVLDALGLTPHFRAILTPDTHNALKKNPAFFGEWAKKSSVTIMVGDNYDDDVRTPVSEGFKTVWKHEPIGVDPQLAHADPFTRARNFPYRPDQTARPDAIIASLQELPALVKRWETAWMGHAAP